MAHKAKSNVIVVNTLCTREHNPYDSKCVEFLQEQNKRSALKRSYRADREYASLEKESKTVDWKPEQTVQCSTWSKGHKNAKKVCTSPKHIN